MAAATAAVSLGFPLPDPSPTLPALVPREERETFGGYAKHVQIANLPEP